MGIWDGAEPWLNWGRENEERIEVMGAGVRDNTKYLTISHNQVIDSREIESWRALKAL